MSGTSPGSSSEPADFQEEFKLLDIDGGGSPSITFSDSSSTTTTTATPNSSSSSSNTQFVVAPEDNTLPARLNRLAFTGLNVLVTCSALAVAKQMLNPSSYLRNESAQETAKQLPQWFAAQYQSRRMSSEFARSVIKDTSVLMASSATWYGVQFGMEAVRGKQDAINVCTAGALSAALLGAKFIEPFRVSRVGVWGVVGGVAGYFGYQEQQALRKALLERQQELEQKHMHKPPEEVQQAVNSKLLKHLLELEHQEKLDELKKKMQQHRVVGADGRPPEQVSGSSSGSSSSSSSSSSSGANSSNKDGASDWQGLMSAAPWLPEQQQQQQAGLGRGDAPADGSLEFR